MKASKKKIPSRQAEGRTQLVLRVCLGTHDSGAAEEHKPITHKERTCPLCLALVKLYGAESKLEEVSSELEEFKEEERTRYSAPFAEYRR